MNNNFLVRNYRVIFRSSLIEGFIFSLLFLSGLVRYRFVIVLILRGILSAVNQYYLRKRSKKVYEHWSMINGGLIIIFIISILLDLSKGQVSPKYPDLSALTTIISVCIGYSFVFIFLRIGGSLVQKLSGEEIFTVCPSCGFANVKVVDECRNCGYKKGLPLIELSKKKELQKEVIQEINEYKKIGLYGDLPREVLTTLRSAQDEYVLIALKSPFKYLGGSKDEITLPSGWFILTNNRIICYSGFKGWVKKEEILYSEIKEMDITSKQAFTVTRKSLLIKTLDHSFQFSIGFTKADKILKGFWSSNVSNDKTIRYLLNCIEKHKPKYSKEKLGQPADLENAYETGYK